MSQSVSLLGAFYLCSSTDSNEHFFLRSLIFLFAFVLDLYAVSRKSIQTHEEGLRFNAEASPASLPSLIDRFLQVMSVIAVERKVCKD